MSSSSSFRNPCEVVRYFGADVPSCVQRSAEWRARVTSALLGVSDMDDRDRDTRWSLPSGFQYKGWKAVLTTRASLLAGGFFIDPNAQADVVYANSDSERDIIQWMATVAGANPTWVDNITTDTDVEVLNRLPAGDLPRRPLRHLRALGEQTWPRKVRQEYQVLVHADQLEARMLASLGGARAAKYPVVGFP